MSRKLATLVAVRVAILGVGAFAIGCKKKPAAETPSDAGLTAKVVADPVPSLVATGAATHRDDAGQGAGAAAPPLPLASEDLELVAVGKAWGSKIIWLKLMGSRVWLSGRNVDAFADGDGSLTTGPDPLKGLPYTAGVHRLDVAGIHPHLYVLRTKGVETRAESPEPTVFVRRGDAWTKARPLEHEWFPHAFVPWADGALLVYSQIAKNAGPSLDPSSPGTMLTYVAPDGTVGAANVTVDRRFMAWSAASDGTTLTLLGTAGTGTRSAEGFETGIHALRGNAKDGMKPLTLSTKSVPGMETYGAGLAELGSVAYVWPPRSLTITEGWKPTPTSVFFLADGKVQAKTALSGDACMVQGAAVVDGALFVIRECWEAKETPALVRISAEGKPERVNLPMLAKKEGGSFRVAAPGDKVPFQCEPKKLLVRPPNDLWIEADCGGQGGIPAVFRRGRPQVPVTLP